MINYCRLLIFILVVSGMFNSCADEQNFDQLDNFTATPSVEASILYVEAPEQLINAVPAGTNFYSQEFNFDAFSEQFFSERVLEGIITYEIENTTSKTLSVVLEFLDESGAVLDTELFDIDPTPTANLERQIAYGPGGRSIDIIKNTSSIRISATNLADNTSVSNTSPNKIIVRSSGRFTIELIR
ncbi:hypothetical protein [Spongiimicrobium sp. 3-5]|uniref:hypothetical protein n=1 Tax=Spongiimicrobium sp. 3-5 TaxID=3332596 RepID=UPI00398114CE